MGTGFIMINGIWIAVIFFLGSEANEVCYEMVGCFSDKPPWSGIPGRHLLGLPQSPESMNITFSLFTKESGNISQKISGSNKASIATSRFSPSRKTAFVIHGYASTGRQGWVVEMCLLLVHVENINCIAVDWEDGAKGTYFTAASNIRVLGAKIAYLINTLTKMYKYCPSGVHLIGHSLGAHTAGEAGRRIRGNDKQFPGIGRITGLDPAALCFQGMPTMVRLDPSDAIFVDIIHSNGGLTLSTGFGIVNVIGHIDFYPNGGTIMPGCKDLFILKKEDEHENFHPAAPTKLVLKVMLDSNVVLLLQTNTATHLDLCGVAFDKWSGTYIKATVQLPGCSPRKGKMITPLSWSLLAAAPRGSGSCHHSRSHEYFTYSILCPEGFIGYPCKSYDAFKKGKCFPCPKEGCPMMGYYADRFYDKLKKDNPKYFLNTGPTEPFYSWRYNISLKLSGIARGDINIIFHGKEGNREEHSMASGCVVHGQVYSKFIDSEINPTKVTRVAFVWYKWFPTVLWTTLGADRVTLIRGHDGHKSHFCGYRRVTYGVPQILTPC